MSAKTTKPAEGAVKLVLDDETGELVSRNELRKRQNKRERKAHQALARENKASTEKDTPETATSNVKSIEDAPLDPDAMFSQGFLAGVYKDRSVTPVVTRFPPEPNGFLHLGHAKAIAINFGFARHHGGKTILRFDDTNPAGEDEKYEKSAIDIIKWLGYTPSEITYSSDNFDKLYHLAIELIEKGKAYVCHCTDVEIRTQRGGTDGKEGPRFRCKHADQDTARNVAKFNDMRNGKYEPKTAVLRMKQDIESGNPQMWDLAAYRIPALEERHMRAPEWIIFPTYDFTHGLCDSFEGITHSLCTLEFLLSRESYEWLNKTLEVYEPMQRESGRLILAGSVMSKRALKNLVETKVVRGWDDPRLYTLVGIRRRGVPPGAILSFINELGVTTARAITSVSRFEQSVRRYLEHTVPRVMLVLDPIMVTIEDIDEPLVLDAPFSPKDAAFGTHKVLLTKVIYIDRPDFREVDSKGYFRLAPGKSVGLLQAPHPIKAVSFTKDKTTGVVDGIRAVFDKDSKPRTYIQWVPEGSKIVEARIHGRLFHSDDPMTVEGGYLADVNADSETVHPNAMIEAGFEEVRRKAPWPPTAGEEIDAGAETVRFQALRVGYFAVDSDSVGDKVVLNRIVSLKEDTGKK